jgi:ATP-binding cassette subfamily B protein
MSDKKEKKRNRDTEKFIRQTYLVKAKQHKKVFIGLVLSSVGFVFSVNIAPIIYARFIESLVKGDLDSIYKILPTAGLLVAIYLVRLLIMFSADTIWNKEGTNIQGELNDEAYNSLSIQSKNFFDNSFAGSFPSKMVDYSVCFQDALSEYQYNLLPSAITSVFIIFYIAKSSLILVAPLLMAIVVYGSFTIYMRPKRRRAQKERVDTRNTLGGAISDSVSSHELVKAQGAERLELKKLQNPKEAFMLAKIRSTFLNQSTNRSLNLINGVLEVGMLLIAGQLYISGSIDLATVIVATTYTVAIIGNVNGFVNFKFNMQDVYTRTQPMAEIMMMEPEIKDPENPVKLNIQDGQIEFEKASFKYTNSSEELKDDEEEQTSKKNRKEQEHLFKDLSLTIKPGEKIGLVGPSGGGKSTLLKLVLRFYDVDSGAVKVDGVNVKDVIQSKLRQQIAYVPQDPALFHRSIAENIGYSKPSAKLKEVKAAAKQAYVDEFIESLPDGYDTLVGERGVKLSGGQRQRVAIARAILKDAPILLLDEATSALDSESESYIQKSLEKLMKSRTTVVVAHRLSTIRKMDRIIVVDKGRVIDSGPHEQLLKTSQLYKKLWSHQSGGILQD